jgi:NADPH:quinone reductase-like Zn-dependent oxidoreductase
MKAVRLAKPGGLDNLELVDMDAPRDPGPGEIRVRIRASSLNFHDFAVAMGFIPADDGRIPMADTPATWFTKAPKGWSHAEAATITTAGLTAWRALVVDGGLKAGDTVLVLGTGGVSIYALQLGRAMGATVIATSSSDEKLERVRELGAAHGINYKTTPEWGRRVLELTGGRGADIVVEVGGPGTLPQSIRAARIGGHIALIGVLTGRAGEIPTALLMAKQQNLRGLIVGSRAQQIDFVRALEATGLKPVIDKTFALAQLADAFKHEASGQHFGKICVEI